MEFSRKLLKGIHFFDSIKDILDKVVAYPKVIKDIAYKMVQIVRTLKESM